ncbi:MAG: hypothetical protein LBB48_02305 [Treponema sp.]|nr:hypothetical protein [Treponema sp.]
MLVLPVLQNTPPPPRSCTRDKIFHSPLPGRCRRQLESFRYARLKLMAALRQPLHE